MNLYIITHPKQQGAYSYLQKAAEERSIPLHEILFESFDYLNPPQLKKGDALYRLSIPERARQVEGYLYSKEIATLYKGFPQTFPSRQASHIICKNNTIPMPKTIFSLTEDRKTLDGYVENLGGYPVIIKVRGGTRGVGILRVDSQAALYGLVDYLIQQDANAIMRQYIETSYSARIVVLGSQVIASKINIIQKGDFRSNVGAVEGKKHDFSEAVKDIAVKAVETEGLEFGGVDMVFDSEDNPYVLEVNYPASFPATQDVTGVDIAGKMIDYLVQKSKQIA